jgi:hypothetical protein
MTECEQCLGATEGTDRTRRDTGLHQLNKACALVLPQTANRLDQILTREDICIDID